MEEAERQTAKSPLLVDFDSWWPIEDLTQVPVTTSFQHDSPQWNTGFNPSSSSPCSEFQAAEFGESFSLGLCNPQSFSDSSVLADAFFDPSQSAHCDSLDALSTSWSVPSIHNEKLVQNSGGEYINKVSRGESSEESLPLKILPPSSAWVPNMEDPSHPYLKDGLFIENQNTQLYNSHRTLGPSNLIGLPRRRSRYRLHKSASTAAPIFIPNQSIVPESIQRWQDSPPKDEPASMSAIMRALDPLSTAESTAHHYRDENRYYDRRHDSFRRYRKTASIASSQSSASASSRQSAGSTCSATLSIAKSSMPRTNRSYGRVRRSQPDLGKGTDRRRIFCCTFCCDRFKSKYDWVRHEKSLHLNLESWICAPHGGSVVSPLTGRQHCAYCNALDPTSQHLDEHNHRACFGSNRAFRRKDHLTQHLRLTHRLNTMPLIDDWKANMPAVVSRCGFCDQHIGTWEERVEHLAGHFRKNLTMNDWRGDHEFSPEITAQITNALPPYLIGPESSSVVPFSATNPDVKDHFAQISTRADWDIGAKHPLNRDCLALSSEQHQVQNTPLNTFTEILTLHLSRYARQQMKQGICPTDESFQQESRRVLYDCEDSWNQTIADNPEWLSAFRQLYCGNPG